MPVKITVRGTLVVVQWLRLCASTAGGRSSFPSQGTKIPHAVQCSQKIRKKKITVRYHFTPNMMAWIKMSDNKCWQGSGKSGNLIHWKWEWKMQQLLWEIVWQFLNWSNRVTAWPSNSTWVLTQQKWKQCLTDSGTQHLGQHFSK